MSPSLRAANALLTMPVPTYLLLSTVSPLTVFLRGGIVPFTKDRTGSQGRREASRSHTASGDEPGWC